MYGSKSVPSDFENKKPLNSFYFQNPMAKINFHRSDSNILWLRGRIGFHHRFLQEKFCVGVGESRAVLHMKKYSVSIFIPNGYVQQKNK